MPRNFLKQTLWLDPFLFWSALSLILIGLLIVTSASMVISEQKMGVPFYFVIRQAIYLSLAVGVAATVYRIPIVFWRRIARWCFVLSVVALFLVLIPGVGREVNGSRRWLHLGFITLQVSECAKCGVIIYIADYLARCHHAVIHKWSGFIYPMALLGVVGILLLAEPDFGAATVLTFTCLAMMFMAGVRLWPFALMVLVVVLALAILAWTSPYRMARLTAFLNPWLHPFGSGYQLTQSLIAFGRGGFWGAGLGNGIQKLFYLPEAHTDFVYAVLAEELGLWGQFLVIGLFSVWIGRGLKLARRLLLQDAFSAYLAVGLCVWIALQVLINIGVNAGVLPTKGLTLPFISYGGSSLLMNGVVVGMMLRLAHESEQRRGISAAQREHKIHEAW